MPTPSSTSVTSTSASQPSPLKVAGLLAGAVVASCLANTLVAVIALAAGASDNFQPLQPGAYISFTVLGVLIGAAGWALVRRRPNASRLLSILVPVVVVVSFVPDLAMLVSDYTPDADATGVVALLLMHVVVAVISVLVYRRALPVHYRD
ncbi:DUF6069 family protein [Streptomyces sp. NPDC002793]|uniref:DUF6069 family protein n=1 Tax=Streptomyces sp. NPDC002793 TaxID=3154432 RepID=UPI0033345E38